MILSSGINSRTSSLRRNSHKDVMVLLCQRSIKFKKSFHRTYFLLHIFMIPGSGINFRISSLRRISHKNVMVSMCHCSITFKKSFPQVFMGLAHRFSGQSRNSLVGRIFCSNCMVFVSRYNSLPGVL